MSNFDFTTVTDPTLQKIIEFVDACPCTTAITYLRLFPTILLTPFGNPVLGVRAGIRLSPRFKAYKGVIAVASPRQTWTQGNKPVPLQQKEDASMKKRLLLYSTNNISPLRQSMPGSTLYPPYAKALFACLPTTEWLLTTCEKPWKSICREKEQYKLSSKRPDSGLFFRWFLCPWPWPNIIQKNSHRHSSRTKVSLPGGGSLRWVSGR